jgi:hypothetical protein
MESVIGFYVACNNPVEADKWRPKLPPKEISEK